MNLSSFGFSYRDSSRFARGSLPMASAQILTVILGVATIRASRERFHEFISVFIEAIFFF
jgi:hypothetical protein